MDHFYIIANFDKDVNLETTLRIQSYLEKKGKTCAFRERESAIKGRYTDEALVPQNTQCVIVLGGDGTLIQAARDLVKRDLPLLGINLGTLGYLTEVDKHSVLPTLDRLIQDDFYVEERVMLSGQVIRQGRVLYEDVALNDIVLARGASLRVIYMNIYVNGEFLNLYSADGMIIATPTGSTAYNLSAGGPIVEPGASIVLLTPVSPHTLNNRSIVLGATNHITIELTGTQANKPEGCIASFDGNDVTNLRIGDTIEIDKSHHITRIIKLSKISFLETLRNKMSG